MGSNTIRVLIIDDSALMRGALQAVLESDPSIEVIGVAKDGREGVEKAFALKPDVITIDLRMPIMGGLEAIEDIMEKTPTPIIVVSTADISIIIKALSIGAMDFVNVLGDIDTISSELISKVKIASRVKPLRRFKSKLYTAPVIQKASKVSARKIIAIGISTGGPQALEELFRNLPTDLNAGILVVQHMSRGFIAGLGEWLNGTSSLKVDVAKAGDVLKNGLILLAPDCYHINIDKDAQIVLKEETSKDCFHIPSIDSMMRSVASAFGEDVIGVLMTGMGQDGVEGMRAIKKAGGITIAQDETSSVVFGMNKVAIDAGLIDEVLPLKRIASRLTELVR